MEDIKKEHATTPELQVLNPETLHPDWALTYGVYLFKGKIYLPQNSSLKTYLLKEFHSLPLGGHGVSTRPT